MRIVMLAVTCAVMLAALGARAETFTRVVIQDGMLTVDKPGKWDEKGGAFILEKGTLQVTKGELRGSRSTLPIQNTALKIEKGKFSPSEANPQSFSMSTTTPGEMVTLGLTDVLGVEGRSLPVRDRVLVISDDGITVTNGQFSIKDKTMAFQLIPPGGGNAVNTDWEVKLSGSRRNKKNDDLTTLDISLQNVMEQRVGLGFEYKLEDKETSRIMKLTPTATYYFARKNLDTPGSIIPFAGVHLGIKIDEKRLSEEAEEGETKQRAEADETEEAVKDFSVSEFVWGGTIGARYVISKDCSWELSYTIDESKGDELDSTELKLSFCRNLSGFLFF